MDYLIIENGLITNVIVCDDDETAALFGAVPYYDGAGIGQAYEPPAEPEPEPTTEELFRVLLGIDEMEVTGKTGGG